MLYREALDYIYSRLPMFQRIGPAAYKADLSTTITLADALSNLHVGIPCIHVAGTNGKGSVSSMLAAVLSSVGYRTGLFTSPHLVDYRERIRISGKKIDKDFVASFIEANHELFERIKPSFFEVSFVMAAEWFRKENVEVVVWETGMGGRLDSTNLVAPLLSIITNISFDHIQFLGDTLGKIAFEKAGIIKANTPIIIGSRHPETDAVFIDRAKELNSPIIFASDRWQLRTDSYSPLEDFIQMDAYCEGRLAYGNLKCGLPGFYQLHNIPAVLEALSFLKQSFRIDEMAVYEGLSRVRELSGIAGRWLKIGSDPVAYCDTGHNPAGISEVLKLIQSIKARELRMVIGMVEDKDAEAVLSLLPRDAAYYFCRAAVPRAMPAERLMQTAVGLGMKGEAINDCMAAYLKAVSDSHPGDFIFVGGSTFVVADVLQGTGFLGVD